MAEFESEADVFANFFLEVFNFVLSRKEITCDFVIKKSFAGGFELADFSGGKFDSSVLFLV